MKNHRLKKLIFFSCIIACFTFHQATIAQTIKSQTSIQTVEIKSNSVAMIGTNVISETLPARVYSNVGNSIIVVAGGITNKIIYTRKI